MEVIDLSQLLNYFKSKIIYIIFAMSIAFCLSSIYVNRFRVPEYTNSTSILLNQSSDTVAINYNDINLNKSLISTYSEIIRSKPVINQVIDKLDLDMTYGTLVSKISVTQVTDIIIRISVTDSDSKLAADIANAIAEVFSEEITTIFKIENLSIIEPAEASEVASSASTIKIIGVATIAGAFLSVAIIFITFYFDTTIKNEEDIERATGLPVIGVVPTSRSKGKFNSHKYADDLSNKGKSEEILPIEREIKKVDVIEKPMVKPIMEVQPESTSTLREVELDGSIFSEIKSLERKSQENALKNELTKIKIEALEEDKQVIKKPNNNNNYNHKKKYYVKKN